MKNSNLERVLEVLKECDVEMDSEECELFLKLLETIVKSKEE